MDFGSFASSLREFLSSFVSPSLDTPCPKGTPYEDLVVKETTFQEITQESVDHVRLSGCEHCRHNLRNSVVHYKRSQGRLEVVEKALEVLGIK